MWLALDKINSKDGNSKIAETERLNIRWLTKSDAKFIYQLLNTDSWLKHIGDKDIHSVEDARKYLVDGPISMYKSIGIGLYLVEIKGQNLSIGICGLIKRDSLEHIDIGFAFRISGSSR